ncbi:hypothetical protein GCM10010306_099160 [Streptomyces umbrinus]|uniref:hypothetical protein n=1 Tax=Streptomyces umbrinus TaxID=67370 RepID=UPI001679129E|nr:hypothetical protein [Streptomyces umbrinus]GHB88324.1 hypothetical protein GCM10010306_099160 [Streptomyces umbrinus]
MNTLLAMPGLPILLIVFAAALATIGLAFLLLDLIGRRPKAKEHDGRPGQRVRPAVGSYVLLAEASGYLEYEFGAVRGSIGIVVRHSLNGIDDSGVFVHWLTKPDDLVHQDLAALEDARIYGVRCELDELAFFEHAPAARPQHRPLTQK